MSQLDIPEIQNSRCFGVAFDKDASECKICQVKNVCQQRCMADVKKPTPAAKPTVKKNTAAENTTETMKPATARPEPQKEAAKAPAKKSSAKKASSKEYDPNMPDFKPMALEDLENLAVERGLNLEDYNKYADVSIRRMRLTMGIKKTYEI